MEFTVEVVDISEVPGFRRRSRFTVEVVDISEVPGPGSKR